MARTTSADVEGVIEVDSSISLTPFISVANRIVTAVCTSADLTDDDLEDIEKWLAAHFYAVRDMRNATETVGKVSEQKQYMLGLQLASTMYGQAAMAADTSGALAAYNAANVKGVGNRRVSITWLGTENIDIPTE